MKKIVFALFAYLGMPVILAAQSDSAGLDDQINEFFGRVTGPIVQFVFSAVPVAGVGVPVVLIVLVLGALYFTFYFGFVNFRNFGTAINVVRGKYDDLEIPPNPSASDSVSTVDGDNPDTIKIEGHQGEVSHFQALTAALSATVGLGNIAGVAIAISLGGPGATFWLIIAGLIGMASKFTECTLGVKYREINEDGTVFGGPMYYLSKGFAERGWGRIGKGFAIFFAIMCIGGSFGGGNMFQSNQSFCDN